MEWYNQEIKLSSSFENHLDPGGFLPMSSDNHPPLPIAVLISGGGTTLKNLLDLIAAGKLPIEICLVISSRSNVRGIEIAKEAGIKTAVLLRRNYSTSEAYREATFEQVRQTGAKYVVMGGYLQHLLIPDDFRNRVINIHPSLIPAFCGKGYYGIHVHEAVLEYGVKVTGCTVHFVDDQYDHGPVILQRSCPVLDDDTPETLQKRVFEVECDLLPEAIRLLACNQITIANGGRRVVKHNPSRQLNHRDKERSP